MECSSVASFSVKDFKYVARQARIFDKELSEVVGKKVTTSRGEETHSEYVSYVQFGNIHFDKRATSFLGKMAQNVGIEILRKLHIRDYTVSGSDYQQTTRRFHSLTNALREAKENGSIEINVGSEACKLYATPKKNYFGLGKDAEVVIDIIENQEPLDNFDKTLCHIATAKSIDREVFGTFKKP